MRTKIMVIAVSGLLLLSACATHTHTVGKGAQGSSEVSKRQYWVMGLFPLNEVDGGKMAGGDSNYTVTSQVTIVDAIIGGFLVNAVMCRTVTVNK